MRRLILAFISLCGCYAQADPTLRPALEQSYQLWRNTMIQKDAAAWQRAIAPQRRIEIKNRIVSEKRQYPNSVFQIPVQPPALTSLKCLSSKQNGPTAKACYFGKIDFGVGGTPTDNLLVISYVRSGTGWLYDKSDYINLIALPDVRKELLAGDLKYLEETPDCQPNGILPPMPVECSTPQHIGRVYVFCPGREVNVQVNRISRHQFSNAKEAETVIGGLRNGSNEVSFSVRALPGAKGNEAMTIRVYTMPDNASGKPAKVFEYQVQEKQPFKPHSTQNFVIKTQ